MLAFARVRRSRQLTEAMIRRLSAEPPALAGLPGHDASTGMPLSVRSVAAEIRLAEVEAAATAAESRAALLEAALDECRVMLRQERAESLRAKEAARRERDTLLEKVSVLMAQASADASVGVSAMAPIGAVHASPTPIAHGVQAAHPWPTPHTAPVDRTEPEYASRPSLLPNLRPPQCQSSSAGGLALTDAAALQHAPRVLALGAQPPARKRHIRIT